MIRLRVVDTRRWIVPALLIWGVAITLAAWNPPRFTWPDPPFLRPERFVPFWSYFGSRTLEDLTDVVGQAMVFMPLGALLAARSWRHVIPEGRPDRVRRGDWSSNSARFSCPIERPISVMRSRRPAVPDWVWPYGVGANRREPRPLGATRYRVAASSSRKR